MRCIWVYVFDAKILCISNLCFLRGISLLCICMFKNTSPYLNPFAKISFALLLSIPAKFLLSLFCLEITDSLLLREWRTYSCCISSTDVAKILPAKKKKEKCEINNFVQSIEILVSQDKRRSKVNNHTRRKYYKDRKFCLNLNISLAECPPQTQCSFEVKSLEIKNVQSQSASREPFQCT